MALGGQQNQAFSDSGMGLRAESPCLTPSSFLEVHIQRVALSSGGANGAEITSLSPPAGEKIVAQPSEC